MFSCDSRSTGLSKNPNLAYAYGRRQAQQTATRAEAQAAEAAAKERAEVAAKADALKDDSDDGDLSAELETLHPVRAPAARAAPATAAAPLPIDGAADILEAQAPKNQGVPAAPADAERGVKGAVSYEGMIFRAIAAMGERSGSSVPDITAWIAK